MTQDEPMMIKTKRTNFPHAKTVMQVFRNDKYGQKTHRKDRVTQVMSQKMY